MSWTDERVDTLKQLWHQGFTASQIAERLGNLSRNAVIGKAHRLGLSGRPSPIKGGSREDGAAAESAGGAQTQASDAATAAAPPENEQPAGPAGSPATASSPASVTPAKNDAGAPTPSDGNGSEKSANHADKAPAKAKPDQGNGRSKPNGGASILDLNDRVCKWPIGDPRESDFRFCGGPAVPGLPYCAEHAAQAYQSMPRALDEDEDTSASRPRL